MANGVLLLSTADPNWVRRFGPSPSTLETIVFLSPALPVIGVVLILAGVDGTVVRRALFTYAAPLTVAVVMAAALVFAVGLWVDNCSLPAKPEIVNGHYVLDYHGQLSPLSEGQFWSYTTCARKGSAFISFVFGLAATLFLTALIKILPPFLGDPSSTYRGIVDRYSAAAPARN